MIIFYFDMDGVIAKWNEFASEEETHQHGYFINREVEESVIRLIKRLLAEGYDVRILSAVYTDDHSAREKMAWLDKVGLAAIRKIFVPYGESKYKFIDAPQGSLPVLIDDYSKNLNEWADNGFLPVKFFNGINNRPKLKIVEGGNISITLDSWYKDSIDNRMTTDEMYDRLMSITQYAA